MSKNADLYVNLITLTRYHRREIRFWETSQCVLLCDQCHPSLVLLSPQRLACHLPQWLLAVKVKRKSTYIRKQATTLKIHVYLTLKWSSFSKYFTILSRKYLCETLKWIFVIDHYDVCIYTKYCQIADTNSFQIKNIKGLTETRLHLYETIFIILYKYQR